MEIPHKKGTLYYLAFPMIDSTTPSDFKTSETVTATAYTKTGAGSWTTRTLDNSVSEIGAGMYALTLSTSDTNFDQLLIKMSSSGAADTMFLFMLNTLDIDDQATSAALTTAQDDLDTITGSDGVTLATAQALYAPNKVVPDAAGVAPTAVEIRAEMDSNSTRLTNIVGDTNELQTNQGNWLTATGFSTLVASDIVSDGTAINTTAGVVDSVTLVATTTDVTNAVTANVTSISGSSEAADNLEASAETIVLAATTATTLTTTTMSTTLTEATDDHYNGRIVIFTSGVLQDQATDITDYTGSTKLITMTALTEAPADGDTFNIV